MQRSTPKRMSPRTRHFLKWGGGILLALVLLIAFAVLVFDWNWLRGPITRMATEKTGRVLAISGDLKVKLGWPNAHLQAANVSFANPSWAKAGPMISVENVEASISLPQLLRKKIVFPEVRLGRAVVSLEQSPDGRKNWLLDRQQLDEEARVSIGILALVEGKLNYDDAKQKTHLQSEVSTRASSASSPEAGVDFSVKGSLLGLALNARGSGGPVLSLRDERTPYPLKIDATIGRTTLHAAGRVTSLTQLTAIDMQLGLRGDSLGQLYPLLGVALPETPAYTTQGHLTRAAKQWRYEKFTAHVGQSDLAGTLKVDTAAQRPLLQGEVVFKALYLADLGPVIGAKKDKEAAVSQSAPAAARVLPDVPFRTGRWDSLDADVHLSAKTIHRAESLPIDNLVTHLRLRDSVLTLDPLNFGFAGGQLTNVVSLDGRQDPIHARIKLKAHKLRLNKLFPTFDLNKTSIGQINGELDLEGKGDSVGRMLGTSNGTVALVIADGEISKLMMESVGLHLWEMLQLKITGDKVIKIRCGIATLDVKQGIMQPSVLLLDTDVTLINVTGNIDLGQETLDLTLRPKTKKTSLIALRPPIYVRGSFAHPAISINKGQVAARGLGAVALGLVNPFLLLLPLVETGPGIDSDCGRLIKEAQAR